MKGESPGDEVGAVVQEHSPSSNVGFKSRGVDAICGLSLLLVLFFAPRGFSCFPRPHNPTESNFFFQFDQYWLLVIQSLLHSPLSFIIMQCETSSKTTRHSIRNRQRWQLNHFDPRDLNLCFWFIYLWNGHYILSNLQAYPFVKWSSTPQCLRTHWNNWPPWF